jgi:hypothetical protein
MGQIRFIPETEISVRRLRCIARTPTRTPRCNWLRFATISLCNWRSSVRHTPVLGLCPFLQPLLEHRTVALQELFYGSLGLFVLLVILQSLEGGKISSASIFQGWDRKFGELVLRREGPIDLRIRIKFSDWVRHRCRTGACKRCLYTV